MSDQTSSKEPLDENRLGKGRTIDLEAAEIKNMDAQSEAPSDAQPAPSVAVEQPPDDAGDFPHPDSAGAPAPTRSRTFTYWKALIAGGLSGAVLSAGITAAGLLMIRDTDLKGLANRLSRAEDQINETKSKDGAVLQGLADRVAKLEGTIAKLESAPPDIASAQRFSALANDMKALSARAGAAAQQAEGATSAAREARQRSEANAAALAELANKVASTADSEGREKIAGDVRSLTDRIAAVESKLTKTRDASGRLAVAAIALSFAAERGQAFAPELAAAKSLGADPALLAPLDPFAQSGIPSRATLSRELLDLLPSLRAIEPAHGSFFTRLQANAERLVRIRPQDAKGGNDISAILDRTELRASNADVDEALGELEQLPAAVRAPADAWIEKAKARSAAIESSHRLIAAGLADLSQ